MKVRENELLWSAWSRSGQVKAAYGRPKTKGKIKFTQNPVNNEQSNNSVRL